VAVLGSCLLPDVMGGRLTHFSNHRWRDKA